MITGATKNKVDDIWQKMWEGGITNPLEVISQLTYLMFMHQLDEREFEAESLEEALGVTVDLVTVASLEQPTSFRSDYDFRANIERERMMIYASA